MSWVAFNHAPMVTGLSLGSLADWSWISFNFQSIAKSMLGADDINDPTTSAIFYTEMLRDTLSSIGKCNIFWRSTVSTYLMPSNGASYRDFVMSTDTASNRTTSSGTRCSSQRKTMQIPPGYIISESGLVNHCHPCCASLTTQTNG